MFKRAAMMMDKDDSGWKVDSVTITREGPEPYSMAPNAPSATDGEPLPRGRPFSCTVPREVNGEMVATLSFDPAYITRWHDHSTDPFDNRRTIILKMEVEGDDIEDLFVDLSCLKMAHSQPRPSVAALAFQAVVAIALAIVQFFKQVFGLPKQGVTDDVDTDLAAVGARRLRTELRH